MLHCAQSGPISCDHIELWGQVARQPPFSNVDVDKISSRLCTISKGHINVLGSIVPCNMKTFLSSFKALFWDLVAVLNCESVVYHSK